MTEKRLDWKKLRELHDEFWNKPFCPIDLVPEPIIRIAKNVGPKMDRWMLIHEVLEEDAKGIDTTEKKERLKELNKK